MVILMYGKRSAGFLKADFEIDEAHSVLEDKGRLLFEMKEY